MIMLRTNQILIYSVYDLNITEIIKNAPRVQRKKGNPGKKDRPLPVNMVCAFDIETSYLPDIEQSFMYVWQFQLGEYTIMGRSWEEFMDLLMQIRTGLKSSERLIVYVHNLSYEFQFLRGIYPFTEKEVFCMDRRKIVRCEMYNAVEFKCSYIHSNMSLDEYCKKMGCEIRKLTGTFDYEKIRYPWTELSEDELMYCINDVRSLVEALTREMAVDGDTLDTIPLTSTGYVRRKCKLAMRSRPAFHSYISDQLPDYDLYIALREAFRGGNTHANRWYVGRILDHVQSVDRSSSYPDVLVNHEYPISFFKHRGPISMDRFMKNKNVHHRACLIRIALFNVSIKNWYDGCPYLSKDKCRMIHGGLFDNGRILFAEYLETTVTDVDWDIIESQYDYENPCIFDSWFTRYGKLPVEFTDTIIDMYWDKTGLKGDPDQAVYYGKIKAMINALYGMTAQNPLRLSFTFSDNDYHIKEIDGPTELMRYNRNAFLAYQWGVWCTAWARYELQQMIDIAGDGIHTRSCFIYCDTDSVKYTGEIDIEPYNNRQIEISYFNGGCAADSNGDGHCLGVYEREKSYDRFITWGAKRYAYDQSGSIGVTTAGVVAKGNAGGIELSQHGGLEAYKPGFTFRSAGGTEALYNDNVNITLEIDNHTLRITDNVCIRESEYTLGITGEYDYLLKHTELLYDLWTEFKREKELENSY